MRPVRKADHLPENRRGRGRPPERTGWAWSIAVVAWAMKVRKTPQREIHALINAWRMAIGKPPLQDPRQSRPDSPYYREARRWADVGRAIRMAALRNGDDTVQVPLSDRELEIVDTLAQASDLNRATYLGLIVEDGLRALCDVRHPAHARLSDGLRSP